MISTKALSDFKSLNRNKTKKTAKQPVSFCCIACILVYFLGLLMFRLFIFWYSSFQAFVVLDFILAKARYFPPFRCNYVFILFIKSPSYITVGIEK